MLAGFTVAKHDYLPGIQKYYICLSPLSGLHFFLIPLTFKISSFLSGLRYMKQNSEFPHETRRVLQVETWLFRGGVNCMSTPTKHLACSPPQKLSKSSGGAPGFGAPCSGTPGSGTPGYGRTWVHLIAFSRWGLKFFFRFPQVPPATQRRAVPCGVVPCRAVLCPAVRCRAVPCCAVLSLSYIPGVNASKHTELTRASMSSNILCSSLHFPFLEGSLFFHPVPVYGNSSSTAAVCSSMLSLNREHSNVQHSTAQSPLNKAANQVCADQSTYQNKYVRTCMLRPVCFLEHGALGIRKSIVCT